MDYQDLDCVFEKCMTTYTELYIPSSECCPNSNRSVSVNESSTANHLKYFARIFLPVISGFGIVCNLINIYVLLRIKYKSCFLRLLCYLAVFDTVILLPGVIDNIYFNRTLCRQQHGRSLLSLLYHIRNKLQPIELMVRFSKWFTVAISMERFLGISYPLKFPAKYRKSRHFVIPVLLITVLDTFMYVYTSNGIFLRAIPFIITPILIIFILNFKILNNLIAMKDITRSSNAKVLDSALILISVAIIFLFSWTPFVIYQFYFDIFKAIDDDFRTTLLIVGHCALIFNSSINFFIYCLVGKRYRQHVAEAFACSSTGSTRTLSILIHLFVPQVEKRQGTPLTQQKKMKKLTLHIFELVN